MTDLEPKHTAAYARNRKEYRVWVACTYTLHPGMKTSNVRTPKWITGCYDMAEAEQVKEMLQCFPRNFKYISIKENEHKFAQRVYQISLTDAKETIKYLKIKLKEAEKR